MSENVKLSDDAVAWADQKVAAGEYESRSAYFEAQVEAAREYEAKRAELRRLIQDGIDSGVSDKTVEDVWAEVSAELKADGSLRP